MTAFRSIYCAFITVTVNLVDIFSMWFSPVMMMFPKYSPVVVFGGIFM